MRSLVLLYNFSACWNPSSRKNIVKCLCQICSIVFLVKFGSFLSVGKKAVNFFSCLNLCAAYEHVFSGAPADKHVLLFADDLNLPKLDPYGSQPPIELLRQLVDFGGLYDREKLFWKVSFIIAFGAVAMHTTVTSGREAQYPDSYCKSN